MRKVANGEHLVEHFVRAAHEPEERVAHVILHAPIQRQS